MPASDNSSTKDDLFFAINLSVIIRIFAPRPFANTRFNKGNDTILTVSENNNLIVKAFATAWCYREMYEECGDVDTVARKVGSTPRTIYKYLDIAYMNPKRVNQILDGTITCTYKNLLNDSKQYSL